MLVLCMMPRPQPRQMLSSQTVVEFVSAEQESSLNISWVGQGVPWNIVKFLVLGAKTSKWSVGEPTACVEEAGK